MLIDKKYLMWFGESSLYQAQLDQQNSDNLRPYKRNQSLNQLSAA
jgi:hypothetical protein